MENTNQKKLIYQYGLLTGTIAVAFEIMRFSMGIHYENDGITTLVSILSYLEVSWQALLL
tara:strand:- start:378 stop:557 length:180 start_codon:yes stop_codon:yes gene_type:complete